MLLKESYHTLSSFIENCYVLTLFGLNSKMKKNGGWSQKARLLAVNQEIAGAVPVNYPNMLKTIGIRQFNRKMYDFIENPFLLVINKKTGKEMFFVISPKFLIRTEEGSEKWK